MKKYLIVLLILNANLTAQTTFSNKGQASVWVAANGDASTLLGMRYIPTLNYGHSDASTWKLDSELAFNGFYSKIARLIGDIPGQSDLKTYRAWVRLSTSQFELRLGLQKLNFGPAMLMRPLMWFDQIDPRDPLQLTDGVYALLARYYFLNNANIWLWALKWNDGQRGMDFFTSDKEKPEYGGRIQVPVLSGEFGFSFHQRTTKPLQIFGLPVMSPTPSYSEKRYGLDGRLDYFIGMWFEGVLLKRDQIFESLNYEHRLTIGGDYTIPFRDGITVLAEYFKQETSSEAFAKREQISISAFSVRYPMGLLDNLSAIFYYNSEMHSWFRFANWQRTYNNWQINRIAFSKPDEGQIYGQTQITVFSGKGGQVMLVFNY